MYKTDDGKIFIVNCESKMQNKNQSLTLPGLNKVPVNNQTHFIQHAEQDEHQEKVNYRNNTDFIRAHTF